MVVSFLVLVSMGLRDVRPSSPSLQGGVADGLTPWRVMRIYMCMALDTNSRKVIKRLKAEGWTFRGANGSHHQFEKGKLRVTVVHPRKDMSIGTARTIARTAGWLSVEPPKKAGTTASKGKQ